MANSSKDKNFIFRLSEDDRELLDYIRIYYGVTKAEALRKLIRNKAVELENKHKKDDEFYASILKK